MFAVQQKTIIFAATISATPLYNAYQGGTYFLYTYGNNHNNFRTW